MIGFVLAIIDVLWWIIACVRLINFFSQYTIFLVSKSTISLRILIGGTTIKKSLISLRKSNDLLQEAEEWGNLRFAEGRSLISDWKLHSKEIINLLKESPWFSTGGSKVRKSWISLKNVPDFLEEAEHWRNHRFP